MWIAIGGRGMHASSWSVVAIATYVITILRMYDCTSLYVSQEKISENSGYFGIRDCHLNDRKVVTYSEQR